MRVWSRGVAVLVLLVAPVFVACGGGDDPSGEGTPTPKFSSAPASSDGSGSPSGTPTGQGSGSAEPKTPQQVARAFFDDLSGAINTGETEPFLRHSTSGCSNCRAAARLIRKRYDGGGTMENPSGWQLVDLERLGKAPTQRGTVFAATIDVGSQKSLNANGKVVSRSPASTQTSLLLMRQVQGQLRVAQWDVKP